MALTRKMLEAMSIEPEKIDQIIEQHVQTVNEVKDERDSYKEQAKELDDARQRITELEKANGNSNKLQVKYDALVDEFNDYKGKVENERLQAQRETLYTALLKDAGIDEKRVGSILKVTDLSSLEITEDGAIADADNLKSQLAEEWSDFIVTTETRGAGVDTPPPTGTKGAMTKEEILAIEDAGERQAAIAENHEMFGF